MGSLKLRIFIFVQFLFMCLTISVLAVNLPTIPVVPEFPVINSNGDVFYVSKDQGNDDKQHGSASNPFKTIQYGVNQLNAGDTLIVMPSSTPYIEEVQVTCVGTASNYITIQGAEGQMIDLVSPSDVEYSHRGFEFRHASYVYLKNFKIHGKYLYGVNLRVGCHNIAIENIESFGNNTGIMMTGSSYVNFKNSEVYNSTYAGVRIHQDTGIQARNIVFRNISSHDNNGVAVDGFGVSLATTDSGKPGNPEDICHELYMYDCKAFGNGGEGIDLGMVKKAVIINSDSYRNGGQGVKVWGEEIWLVNDKFYENAFAGINAKPLYNMNMYILNCIIADNKKMQIRSEKINIMGGVTTTLSPVTIYAYNNFVSFAGAHNNLMYLFDISKNGSIIEDNNLLYSTNSNDYGFILRKLSRVYLVSDVDSGKWARSESFAGSNTFVKSADLSGEYIPLSGDSAVVDKGTDVGLNYDRLGVVRPNGGKVDIGAYEFVKVVTLSTPKNLKLK